MMLNLEKIKGVIFDYGGTLDTNGKHWAEVIWEAYVDNNVPVEKAIFREAYVYVERYLAKNPVVKPDFTFRNMLDAKMELQINWFVEHCYLSIDDERTSKYAFAISEQCYNFARSNVEKTKPILDKLYNKYPMVLVSNFYGNIEAVLKDFELQKYFGQIIESAVVGVRKPDPAIFEMGVKALELPAQNVVVVGDSYTKDIVPSKTIGCQTVWVRGLGWEADDPDATAEAVVYDFADLKTVFQLS